MSKRNVHVVPHDGDWAIKRPNTARASEVFDRKSDALETGREMARQDHSELVIHDRKGVIRDKDSFGGDKCPPKDRRH